MFVFIVASKSSDEISRIDSSRLLPSGVADQNIETAKSLDGIGHQFLPKNFRRADRQGARQLYAHPSSISGNHFVRIRLLGWKDN